MKTSSNPVSFGLKKLLPRSLFMRSLLILTLPVILILVISTYIFFERHWERMTGRLAMAVAGEIALIVETAEGIADNPEAQESLTRQALKHLQLSVQFFDDRILKNENRQLIGRAEMIQRLLEKELASRLRTYPFRTVIDTHEKWIQVQIEMPQGVLIITAPERRLFSSSGYAFLLYMISVATLLMVIAILFMRNQIRPIKRLAVAADRFGKGRDVPFFKIEGAREVRQAARAFLGMRDRLNRQIQQRTAMLAGVSHDLRTPLTRMKLQLALLPDGDDKAALLGDVDEMERMMSAYLQFARGDGDEAMERIDFVAFILRLSEKFMKDDFCIHTDFEGQAVDMFLKPVAMERALSNLISNAQKHAKNLYLSLEKKEEHVVLIMDDDGAGIPPSHYDDVFRPFFRVESSRNKNTGGVGLGLPIANDIILSHGGEITLEQSPKGGLRVIIELPF